MSWPTVLTFVSNFSRDRQPSREIGGDIARPHLLEKGTSRGLSRIPPGCTRCCLGHFGGSRTTAWIGRVLDVPSMGFNTARSVA